MSVKDNSCGIADLQDKMLDILKYFISICEKEGYSYWLAGGSCLGAIRHQGFIPWDDDLDVMMLRTDYEAFWKKYRDKVVNNRFLLCRTTEKKNYRHRVMQIVDVNTTFINKRCTNDDIEHGIYIDVIPLDACSNSFFGRLSQRINSVVFSIFNIQCSPEYNGGKLTGLIAVVSKLLLSIIKNPHKRFEIWSKAEQRLAKEPNTMTKELIVLTSTVKELLHPFPVDWFSARKTQFEDIQVYIPDEAEEYLTIMYGDYMEYPPLEAQTVRHHTVCIDLNNSYTRYRGVFYCNND